MPARPKSPPLSRASAHLDAGSCAMVVPALELPLPRACRLQLRLLIGLQRPMLGPPVLTRVRALEAVPRRSECLAAEPTRPTCPMAVGRLCLHPRSCLLQSVSTLRAGRSADLSGEFWLVHFHLLLKMSKPVLDSRIGSLGSGSPLNHSTLAETRQRAPADEQF